MMNRKGKKIHPIRAVKKDLMDDIGFKLHFQKWDKSWIRGRNETEYPCGNNYVTKTSHFEQNGFKKKQKQQTAEGLFGWRK